MNIVDYIPTGKDQAISRRRLVRLTGLSDRKVRDAIAKARRHTCIINDQDGNGYYIPKHKSEVENYIKQETHRAEMIFYNLNGAKEFYNEMEGQQVFEVEGSDDLSIKLC